MEDYNKPVEKTNNESVNEPKSVYGLEREHDTPRVVSMSEVMSHSLTVEDLDAHLTELIHRHYHPEA